MTMSADCRVKFFIDKNFVNGIISVHPNEA